MVTLYDTYTRYTHAHYQEFIAVEFLRGLVVIAISQLLDLRKKIASYGILFPGYMIGSLVERKCSGSLICLIMRGQPTLERVTIWIESRSGYKIMLIYSSNVFHKFKPLPNSPKNLFLSTKIYILGSLW